MGGQVSAQVIQLFTREVLNGGTEGELKTAREAYLANPVDWHNLVTYADALADANEWGPARVMYAHASEIDPLDWRAPYNEGCCLAHEQQWVASLNCFGRALAVAGTREAIEDISHNIAYSFRMVSK